MKCELVDVFAREKLNGNGLTIFSDCDELCSKEMLAWAQEMRQFESIFLKVKADEYHARIFTVEEELDFAGHPLLGLTYHLHERFGSDSEHEWTVNINGRPLRLSSKKTDSEFIATMSQGRPFYSYSLSEDEAQVLYSSLNLTKPDGLSSGAEVISTGLPYVILPVRSQLEDISFNVRDLTPLIEPYGGKFLYVLDVGDLEGRTWDNKGLFEDVATGSAAGPVSAYLFKHGFVGDGEVIIKQGGFLGRPSEIKVRVVTCGSEIEDLQVSANVVKVADIAIFR
ncbi:PhzF family phenazine biosynthesis protein [Halomonas pacifica]|uniref:PhzF family phenazine biosynthesis protein n=1 Tax=Bisbaumannia pacifica TaxID=77098 RepID=UPI0023598C65|nr:PhzF family phenazine biosynthesis protein [Halomonas pacifica]MDC8804413.1 PhzF family phenazine biosynthesis protein [Halomonas pacifica]